MQTTYPIRKGVKADLPRALELIKELATFEKALHEVTNHVSLMEQHGFGSKPLFEFLVAEHEGTIVGMSLYYWRYSTWKGKRLYLEDIIVTESERGKGIGKQLFEETLKVALAEDCSGMVWQVLDWNTPAISFYEKYGATISDEWLNCSLEVDKIKALTERFPARD